MILQIDKADEAQSQRSFQENNAENSKKPLQPEIN
jgi:hypothetical protein